MHLTAPLLGSSSEEPGTRPTAMDEPYGKPVSNTMTLQRLSEVHIIHRGPEEGFALIYPPLQSIHTAPLPPSVFNPFSHGYQTERVPRRPVIISFQNVSPLISPALPSLAAVQSDIPQTALSKSVPNSL